MRKRGIILGYIFYCIDILFLCDVYKYKSWDVGYVVKWYGITDKITLEMIK